MRCVHGRLSCQYLEMPPVIDGVVCFFSVSFPMNFFDVFEQLRVLIWIFCHNFLYLGNPGFK